MRTLLLAAVLVVAACGAAAPSNAAKVGGSFGGQVVPVAVDSATTCYVVVYGGEPKSIDCITRTPQ